MPTGDRNAAKKVKHFQTANSTLESQKADFIYEGVGGVTKSQSTGQLMAQLQPTNSA